MHVYISEPQVTLFKRNYSKWCVKNQHGLLLLRGKLCLLMQAAYGECNSVRQHVGRLRNCSRRFFRWDRLHQPALSRRSDRDQSNGAEQPLNTAQSLSTVTPTQNQRPQNPPYVGAWGPCPHTSCTAKHGTVTTTSRDLPAPPSTRLGHSHCVSMKNHLSLPRRQHLTTVSSSQKSDAVTLFRASCCPFWLHA